VPSCSPAGGLRAGLRPVEPINTVAGLFTSIIYNDRPGRHDPDAFGETNMPQVNEPAEESQNMGDKSPKSNQKKISQKQAVANTADQKKKQAVADKQTAGKKK